MGLGESGDWQGATQRIVGMISGTGDPLEGHLPEGPGSGRLLEAFARELGAEYGVELGMAFPAALAAFSAAMQGGFQVPMVKKIVPGGYEPIWVPTVVQFVGIAEAGQLKSTLLGEISKPLKRALDKTGLDDRRALVNLWRAEAMKKAEAVGIKIDLNPGDWDKVYQGGVCRTSVTAQGTPEGIRNNLVELGGHRAIVTAEPDVLREVSAYTQGKGGSGSLGHFLNGWDQDDMAIDRSGATGGGHFVREPSLPCVILLQPAAFQQYTGVGPNGQDDFVSRGVFSRMLLWEAGKADLEVPFPDLEQWDDDAVGWDPAKPMVSGLAVLREKFADRMEAVVARSNPYRVSKALERSYGEAKLAWDMPRPKGVSQEFLNLDGKDGRKAGAMVQNMRHALIVAVRQADAEQHGIGAVLDPFVQRFTSHVMRLAGVLTLADDPGATAVDTAHVVDVATRVMPWLWSGWWRVMRERMEESGRAVVSEGLLKNVKGKDLSGQALMLSVLNEMDMAGGPSAMEGFLPSVLLKKAMSTFTSNARTPVLRQSLKVVLGDLVAEGLAQEVGVTTSANGVKSARIRITDAGRVAAKEHAG